MDDFCSIESHIASFYDKVHFWTIDRVLFLDIRMQSCVPPNIDLICYNTDYSKLLRKSQFILDCLNHFLPLIQLLLRKYGLVKTSSGPKFDHS